MAAKRRGLGRGLDALLGSVNQTGESAPAADAPASAVENDSEFLRLPLDMIQRSQYQPRREFEPQALEELAASIRAQGVMQPIVVRAVGKGKYEIIAGERRWRAAQLAQLDRIPALVKDVSDETAMAMALIENLQRENLNPMEEAVALDRLQREFGLTQQEVADAVGKSRAAVANFIRLMNLNEEVKELLSKGQLDMGHARALLAIDGPAQSQLARKIVAAQLSVRQTEEMIRGHQAGSQSKPTKAVVDPDIRSLEQRLCDQFGAKVEIQHGAKGKGKLVIHYNSAEEFEGILSHIK